MSNRIDRTERLSILLKYRVFIREMTENEARRALVQEFKRDYRTIVKIIKEEIEEEKIRQREKTILDVQAGKGIDWNSMLPQAMVLWYDALYHGRELSATEMQVVKIIINRVDKKNKGLPIEDDVVE